MDGNYEITNKKGIGFILIFPINYLKKTTIKFKK